MVTAKLLLADGTLYSGIAAGKIGTCTGEICFNTGMTGYQEIFTDPSYYGQIMVNTNAHIGNYGVNEQEVESDGLKIAGLVVRNFNDAQFRNLASGTLQDYLVSKNLVAIQGIDTRALVRHIRNTGAMNAILSSEIEDVKELSSKLAALPSMAGLELASQVSTSTAYELGNNNDGPTIALLDLGVKKNILQCFVERGFKLKVFPSQASYKEMLQCNPAGFFFSNGPGDPAATQYAIATCKEILDDNKPFFGICLGHQILALANGIPTFKMHHGHRGLNHPVKNLITGRSEITSQNHGFEADRKSIENSSELILTHVNLNDHSVEGIRHKVKPAFSVQYHPESSPGPHDSRYLFDDFLSLIQSQS